MLLLEIAAQGVVGALPAIGRATLRPGYNVVASDGPALRRLVAALLYPHDDAAEALGRSPPARAGVTLTGDDGATYRLMRDFPGATQLHRYDAATRAFVLVARDAAAVAEHLGSRVGVPAPSRRALLAWSAAELPSRRAGALQGAPSVLARGTGGPPTAAPRVALGLAARLDALRAERARAAELEELQRELDALQTRLFRSDEALKEGARVRQDAEDAEGALAEHARLAEAETALADVDASLEAFERAGARRDEALAKVLAEREALAVAAAPPAPLWREPRMWAGVGGAAAAVGVAIAGARSSPGLRYLALLDIPALGYAAWVALGWIRAVEASERGGRRRALVDEFERKAMTQHDRDVATVRDALATAGVASTAELRVRLRRLGELRGVALAARERLATWEGSQEARDASESRGALEEEIRRVETRLAAIAAGIVRDPRAIEAELEQVERALALAAQGAAEAPHAVGAGSVSAFAGGPPSGFAGEAPSGFAGGTASGLGGEAPSGLAGGTASGFGGGTASGFAAAIPAEDAPSLAVAPPVTELLDVPAAAPAGAPIGRAGLAPPEPIRALLTAAAAELGGDAGPRLRDLAARAAQVASALTATRLSLVLDGASVRLLSGGARVAERDAPPADRDLAFLSVRIAVLERAFASGRPAVAIVDDAFAGLPEGVRRIAAQLLRQASRGGQVLHATSDPVFRSAADHVAS